MHPHYPQHPEEAFNWFDTDAASDTLQTTEGTPYGLYDERILPEQETHVLPIQTPYTQPRVHTPSWTKDELSWPLGRNELEMATPLHDQIQHDYYGEVDQPSPEQPVRPYLTPSPLWEAPKKKDGTIDSNPFGMQPFPDLLAANAQQAATLKKQAENIYDPLTDPLSEQDAARMQQEATPMFDQLYHGHDQPATQPNAQHERTTEQTLNLSVLPEAWRATAAQSTPATAATVQEAAPAAPTPAQPSTQPEASARMAERLTTEATQAMETPTARNFIGRLMRKAGLVLRLHTDNTGQIVDRTTGDVVIGDIPASVIHGESKKVSRAQAVRESKEKTRVDIVKELIGRVATRGIKLPPLGTA